MSLLTEGGRHVGGWSLLLLDEFFVADGAESLAAGAGVEAAPLLAEGGHVLLDVGVAGVHPDPGGCEMVAVDCVV